MLVQSDIIKFNCNEYASGEFSNGYYDKLSHLQLILPLSEASIGEGGQLVIGYAGTDGIEFCYREHHHGVWAYYPIDKEFVLKANSLVELVKGYLNSSILV